MIALGFDIVVVKELLGHADIKTIMIYASDSKQLLRRAVEMFGELARTGYDRLIEALQKHKRPE